MEKAALSRTLPRLPDYTDVKMQTEPHETIHVIFRHASMSSHISDAQSHLLREMHAVQQFLKTRVRVQGIKLHVGFETGHSEIAVAFSDRSVQPRECLRLISETGVDSGDVIS